MCVSNRRYAKVGGLQYIENKFYKYGSDGLTDYVLTNNIAQISDDTQKTLFTADAITCSNLVHIPELFARPAPGTTCMEALRGRQMGTITKPLKTAKGVAELCALLP